MVGGAPKREMLCKRLLPLSLGTLEQQQTPTMQRCSSDFVSTNYLATRLEQGEADGEVVAGGRSRLSPVAFWHSEHSQPVHVEMDYATLRSPPVHDGSIIGAPSHT